MILITGGRGQLGVELTKFLEKKGIPHVSTDSNELDITNQLNTINYVKKMKPSVIYHCAAYTAVDKAEDEGKELNEKVNVEGTRNIVLAAKEIDALLVYISTDYVFDGKLMQGEYVVSDKTNPQNEYGKAKLIGEQIIEANLTRFYIIRTSWVFGKYGNNFVYTMQRLAKENDTLTVVDDQFGRPTWTKTLVDFISYIVENKEPFGVYHLSNDNSCSWFEFAKEILKDNTRVKILPVDSTKFVQKAKRPQYSVMNLDKAKNLGFEIPTWQEALKQFLSEL